MADLLYINAISAVRPNPAHINGKGREMNDAMTIPAAAGMITFKNGAFEMRKSFIGFWMESNL